METADIIRLTRNKDVKRGISFNKELFEIIQEAAKEHGLSENDFITNIIIKELIIAVPSNNQIASNS